MERGCNLIVALVIVSLVVISLGIFVNKVTQENQITGFVTREGNISANIVELVECVLIEDLVDFQTINLGETYDTVSNSSYGKLLLKNNGTVDVDVVIKSGKNATEFFLGTSPLYQFQSSCVVSGCGNILIGDWTAFTKSNQTLVEGLSINSTKDTLRTDLKIAVPVDESAGVKSDVLTFTCSADAFGGEPEPKVLPSIMFQGEELYIYPNNSLGSSAWGCSGDDKGANSDTNGSYNTLQAEDCTGPKICADLSYGGYDDWYLPAKDQLKAVYDWHAANNISKGGYDGEGWENFVADIYWSSTEVGSDFAWGVFFDGGFVYGYGKDLSVRVRCVRG
jgi:hypothetical protein